MELLVHKLVSEVIQLFGRHERIQGDLRKWEKLLVKIKAVLDDADEKQTANQSVKTWLVELENLAYDVEDILDELATEAWRRKLVLEPPYYHPHQPITATSTGTGTSKFRKLIPTCCTKFSPPTVKLDSMIAKQIAEITARFEQIARQKELLDLKENSDGKSRKEFKQQETTSLVMEAEVHGREEEKKSVVELLLKDDLRAEGGFSVIPITGMGGVGKTTLAQLVYNHETVATHFDLKAWACVSEDFDAAKVTKAILKSIRVKTEADDDLNSLQVKLKDGLSRKKFFIVLDDMWNQSYSDWTKLRLPFVVGAPGSKVIVTTRNQDVASMMGTDSAYELKKLSDDDCLPVFTQHSLGTSDFSTHQHLKELGELIVQKCDGLPLAAKTLGGLLRGKSNLSDWKNVLNNKIWGLPEKGGDVMRALRVSYHYLPAYLKRCFAHCSLLPKDYEFDEREIVFYGWQKVCCHQVQMRRKWKN